MELLVVIPIIGILAAIAIPRSWVSVRSLRMRAPMTTAQCWSQT